MNISIRVFLGLGFTFLLSTQLSHGSLLAGWDVAGVDLDAAGASGIDGNSTSSPFTYSAGNLGTNVGTATLTLGSGVNPSTTTDRYGFKISGANTQSTLAGAITENHFLQFEISAASGFFLNLSSLDFVGDTTGTGADNVALLSSIDGFNDSSAIASLSGRQAVGTGALDTDSSGFGAAIDLSGSQYQSISSISFRLYGWNTSSGSGSTFLRDLTGDDLEIMGTVSAIPEVSTIVPLLSVMLIGISAVIFRKRQTLRGESS